MLDVDLMKAQSGKGEFQLHGEDWLGKHYEEHHPSMEEAMENARRAGLDIDRKDPLPLTDQK